VYHFGANYTKDKQPLLLKRENNKIEITSKVEQGEERNKFC